MARRSALMERRSGADLVRLSYQKRLLQEQMQRSLETLLSFLAGLSGPLRIAFFLAQNVAVMIGALAFGAAVVAGLQKTRRISPPPPPIERIEIALAACTVVLNALITAAGHEMHLRGLVHFRVDFGARWLLDLLVLIAGMDFAMYWLHRLAHVGRLYVIHRAHHRYVDPRPLTLFVLSPVETISFGALWLAFLFVYSPSWLAVVAYLTLNVFFGVIGHTGVELFPPLFERAHVLRYLAGSAFHADHHALETCNYGFYTNVWDRIFGTHRPRAAEP